MAAPKQTDPQFKLRMTPQIKDGIEKAAGKNNRSMNAEIVARLEGYPKIRQSLFDTTRENAKLRDEVERLEAELDQFKEIRERFFNEDGSDKPLLAVPQPLLDRIRLSAVQNHRDVDSEAIAALETAFPPTSIDLDVLASFLNTLVKPPIGDEDRHEYDQYLEEINDVLSKVGSPWTVKADIFGQISFYPYPTPKRAPSGDTEDALHAAIDPPAKRA